jgi:hypothetical protein
MLLPAMMAAAVVFLPSSFAGASVPDAAPPSSAAAPPITLQPSRQYAVTVDGAATFVYIVTTDGERVHNSSFVHITLPHSAAAAAASPRKVVVTLLQQPDREGPPPTAAALRPDPVGAEGSLPRVQRAERTDAAAEAASSWEFQVSSPLRAVLEFGAPAFQLDSFSSGLMVFAEHADPEPPRASDPSVVFFGPGVHQLPLVPEWKSDAGARGLELHSHSTLYLAEGAVVLGGIRAYNVRNVTIRGSGIIATTFLPGEAIGGSRESCQWCQCQGMHGIDVANSSDVKIEGVAVMHATGWDVKLVSTVNVHVQRIKVMAWRCWNDGIDIVSSKQVLIDDVFIRSDDDSIAVKGMDPSMDTQDLMIRDSIFWNQRYGNCMEIGFELFNAAIHNITFMRNVCLHQSGSIMSIHNGGQSVVRSVRYQDIVAQTLASDQARGCDGNGCLMVSSRLYYSVCDDMQLK